MTHRSICHPVALTRFVAASRAIPPINTSVLTLSLIVLGLLLQSASAIAQEEAFLIEESPNGQRAQRLHKAALIELNQDYFKSIENADERFAKTSISHVRRYTDAMQRAADQLKREGKTDSAAAVQAAADRAAQWAMTPPDDQGKHFLSDVDFTVAGYKDAVEQGKDLLARIDRLGSAYNRQVESGFDRYAKRVLAARKEYRQDLERVLSDELRAGRHKAVIAVEQELKALDSLKEVDRPEPIIEAPVEQDGGAVVGGPGPDGAAPKPEPATVKELLADGFPKEMRGIYVVHFPSRRSPSTESLMLIIREDGCEAVGWYKKFDEDDKFKLINNPLKLLDHKNHQLVFYQKAPDGRDFVYQLNIDKDKGYKTFFWNDAQAYQTYKSGERGGETNTYKLWQHAPQDVLKDGKYQLQMQASIDPDGNPAKGEVTMDIEVIGGHVFRPAQRCQLGKKRWVLLPAGFSSIPLESWLHVKADTKFADQHDEFHIDMAGGKEPVIKYWWSKYWKMKGQGPSMVGKLVAVDD